VNFHVNMNMEMSLKWTQNVTTNCGEAESTHTPLTWRLCPRGPPRVEAVSIFSSESLATAVWGVLNHYPGTADKSASTLRWQTDIHFARIFSVVLEQSCREIKQLRACYTDTAGWIPIVIAKLRPRFRNVWYNCACASSSESRTTLKYCDT
jgi:hypothetical protein